MVSERFGINSQTIPIQQRIISYDRLLQCSEMCHDETNLQNMYHMLIFKVSHKVPFVSQPTKFISSQCALDVSVISGKPEVDSINNSW